MGDVGARWAGRGGALLHPSRSLLLRNNQGDAMPAKELTVRVDPDVAWIFRSIVSPPDHTFFFCPYTKYARELFPLTTGALPSGTKGTEGKMTAVTDDEVLAEIYQELRGNMVRLYTGQPHHFLTKEKFHYGFCIPPYRYFKHEDGKITAEPRPFNDTLSAFQCSKSQQSDERVGSTHLMCLENMFNAVLPAGIFGAVLPKGWMGRNMRYVNWFQTNIATIARLEIPDEAIYYYDEPCDWKNEGTGCGDKSVPEFYDLRATYCPEQCGTGGCPRKFQKLTTHIKHELIIFGKPVNGNSESQISNLFPFARFRYQPFTFRLSSLDELGIWELGRAFDKHEWQEYYINLLTKAYLQHAGHFKLRLSPSLPPVSLDDPRNTTLFVPGEHAKKRMRIVDSLEDMKRIPTAVHVKVGSKIKLQTYNLAAESMLLELRIYDGRNFDKESQHKWNLDEKLSIMMFHTERDKLTELLLNAGLTPCLLKQDAVRLAVEEKWAERQLTPVERAVRTEDSNGNPQWMTQFEEIGMRACYDQLIEQWRKRMNKMKMNKLAYAFQQDNIILMCCKNGVLNSDVMGLGKTLQILLAYLLRGNKKMLLVVPSKLIGEWQTEIENRLASYCSVARVNWRGESIRDKAQYQIIEWAEDCLPQNLKSINIISYEKLVRPPKDAIYYYCKHCGTTAASLKFTQAMPCPKCNEGRRKKWKQKNREKGYKKYWIKREYAHLKGDESMAHRFQLGGIERDSGEYNRLHDDGYICIDERLPMPDMVFMKRSRNVLIKKKKEPIGFEEKHVVVHGKLEKIQVPVYAFKKRAPHLKWTFSHLLRHRFNIIGVDEADYVKNEKAQRSSAVTHLCAKTKITATGTPVRGYPRSILNILNWTLRRNIFPEYRIMSDKGALGRFYAKYKTEVTNLDTGRKKILPKIMNPEQFQTEISPFMLRHTRNEPAVLACISEKKVEMRREIIDMDDAHREYYQLWLEKFSEWWQKMKEEEERKSVPKGAVLIKLGYLINASTQPHFMLENILRGKDDEAKEWARQIGKYRGPLTQKQQLCFKLVRQIRNLGDKALVFSIRRNNLKLGVRWCAKQNPSVQCMQIDGTISRKINPRTGRSKRQEMLEKFKMMDYSVLWAGLQAMRDGANLPEANHGIFMDLSWEPSDYRQAGARMIRPQQEKTVFLTHLIHKGTLDDYVSLWTILKARSVDEGVDYMEFDDFSSDMIPDCQQYANAIVDGTEDRVKSRMVLAIEHIRRMKERGLTDEAI